MENDQNPTDWFHLLAVVRLVEVLFALVVVDELFQVEVVIDAVVVEATLESARKNYGLNKSENIPD